MKRALLACACLAKWNEDHADKDAAWARSAQGHEVFEVAGCDHREILACYHPSSGRGQKAHQVMCNFHGPPP